MTITDDRATTPTPAATPPSYVRRHPILAAFGVLSGLSLFSALWPLSAIVVGVAVAGHATGLDRAVLHQAERLGDRVRSSVHHRVHSLSLPRRPGTIRSGTGGTGTRGTAPDSTRPVSATARGSCSSGNGSAVAPRAARACAHHPPARTRPPSQDRRAPPRLEDRRSRALSPGPKVSPAGRAPPEDAAVISPDRETAWLR